MGWGDGRLAHCGDVRSLVEQDVGAGSSCRTLPANPAVRVEVVVVQDKAIDVVLAGVERLKAAQGLVTDAEGAP